MEQTVSVSYYRNIAEKTLVIWRKTHSVAPDEASIEAERA